MPSPAATTRRRRRSGCGRPIGAVRRALPAERRGHMPGLVRFQALPRAERQGAAVATEGDIRKRLAALLALVGIRWAAHLPPPPGPFGFPLLVNRNSGQGPDTAGRPEPRSYGKIQAGAKAARPIVPRTSDRMDAMDRMAVPAEGAGVSRGIVSILSSDPGGFGHGLLGAGVFETRSGERVGVTGLVTIRRRSGRLIRDMVPRHDKALTAWPLHWSAWFASV